MKKNQMKLFKNPNRGKNDGHVIEPYVPEHIRLNKEPIEPVLLQKSREEFRRPVPRHIATPPQVKVNSGQNQEVIWNQDPTSTKQFVNNFYNEPLESQALPDFSDKSVERIRDEDIKLPSNQDEIHQPKLDEQQDENLSFTNLNVGEFVLIYDNDIIASGDEDDITSLLETILISEEYNVVEEKLVILKKMNFRTGVLISD